MKKYLYKVLLFSVILFSVLTIVDYCYSALIRRSNYRPVESWEGIVEGNIQADIVALGSSRVWVQIDPQIIDSILCVNSYNLGMDGSFINRQVQKYEIYKNRNAKPKLIIQNIDAWSLGYSTGYEREQFYPYFWDRDFRKQFFRTEPFNVLEKGIPFYRYHGLDPKMFIHSHPKTLHKGYQGQIGEWNGEAYMQQDFIKFTVSDTTLCMFDSFLSQTKKDGIQVVFVYAPLYSGATRKIINLDEMHQTYKDIADKYGIPILDYSDLWICNDTTYFYNAMHLNKSGAEIYTDSLANDIKRLGIL